MSHRIKITLSDENYELIEKQKKEKSVSKFINDLIENIDDKKLWYKLNYMDKELQTILLLLVTSLESNGVDEVKDYGKNKLYKEAKKIVDDKIKKQKDKLK